VPTSAGGFNDLAEAYDRYRTGYADDVYDALAEYGVTAGMRVIDLGCGTGLAVAALAARACAVVGVDVSEPMLARARARVPAATFVRASAEELPFEAASFDAATSAQAFHWFDQPRALAEIARVVRPGGVVAIWWKGLMRGDTTRMLRVEVARELGLTPPDDILSAPFEAFERAPFLDRRLRVIPWFIRTTAREFLGYERSRAIARIAFGDRHEAYFERLAQRFGDLEHELTLSYVHTLYLGRVPEEHAA
jgi:ubiquinone/menaquinone biosynthesis C-methylase UbiE